MVGSGVFNRAGPQGSYKSSDGKTDIIIGGSTNGGGALSLHQHNYSSSNPQTKKFLDQIERIYTKRIESTGQG
jgi:hypothetical protein